MFISYDETYTSFGNYKNRYSGYSYNLEARYEYDKISFLPNLMSTSRNEKIKSLGILFKYTKKINQ